MRRSRNAWAVPVDARVEKCFDVRKMMATYEAMYVADR